MEPSTQTSAIAARKKPRTLRVVFALLAVLILVAGVFLIDRGPTYKGRSVKSWLKQDAVVLKYDDPAKQEARDAFKQFGARAVPIEIRVMSGAGVRFDEWYNRNYYKLPLWAQKRLSKPVHPMRLKEAAFMALLSTGGERACRTTEMSRREIA